MDNTKIAVDKSFLIELKDGIMEAISSEDGLDGGDGEYLLDGLDALLDTAATQSHTVDEVVIEHKSGNERPLSLTG